jgi:8-hydroxy-5-deazaflavin:NADPH oxidoreductase
MDVTIIGAGNMGRGIGTRLVAGGNYVKILDRNPDDARKLADELSQLADDGGGSEGGAAGDPLRGDVVILAVWYDGAQAAIEQYGDQLDDKIVVDVTNPVDVETFDGLVTPPDSSAAEELAKRHRPERRSSRLSTPPSPRPWSRARSAVSSSTS